MKIAVIHIKMNQIHVEIFFSCTHLIEVELKLISDLLGCNSCDIMNFKAFIMKTNLYTFFN